jgi:branched-chain amino acid transport system substrate-binding protein
MRRHHWGRKFGALGISFALVMVVLSSLSNSAGAASAGPIKIAYFWANTGVTESVDQTGIWGAEVAINDINKAGGVLGRKLSLDLVPIPADAAQMPSLVSGLAAQGVKIMSGGDSTAYCVAAAPAAAKYHILDITEGCSGEPLTGPAKLRVTKDYFTYGVSSYMVGSGLAGALIKHDPEVNKLYVVGYSVPPLEEVAQTVEARLRASHPITVESSNFVPYTQDDFSGIATALNSTVGTDVKHQALILTTFGDGTLSFLKQAQASGLLSKFAFVGTSYAYYAAAVSFGGTAPRIWDAYQYDDHSLFNNAQNKAFVAAFKAISHPSQYPDDNALGGYEWVMALGKIIQNAKGLNYNAMLAATTSLHFQGITGPVSVDASSHQFLEPIVVAQIGGDPAAPDKVSASDVTIIPGLSAFKGSFSCGKAFCA